VIRDLLERIGYRVVSPFTGDASFHEISRAHRAKLNILLCHRSINYTNRMMEEKYGIPWLKVNYLGVEDTVKTLRDMAAFFDNPELSKKTEAVIAEEIAGIGPTIKMYKARLQGKRVMLLVGGSRAHHIRNKFETLGMDVVVAGYEFAHRDDYEGRRALSTIVHSGRSKLLEDIHYERDINVVSPYDDKTIRKKKEKIPRLMDYEGLLPHMKDGQVMIDDYAHHRCIHTTTADHTPDLKDLYSSPRT
jgi:nitrogenase molybdenum-iron protein alpha chain